MSAARILAIYSLTRHTKKKINKIIIEMSVQCIQRFLDYKAGNMINIEFSGYIFMDVELSLLLHT